MALTKFVRNVDDLSDDGGYKFRFRCDNCGDGYESQYVSASANLLKTAIEVFSMFNPIGYRGRHVVDGIDRGLRGKERDAAYEKASAEALAHFKKCSGCGRWVCPATCWNEPLGMCETCAPNADEAAAKRAAKRSVERAEEAVDAGAVVQSVTCHACGTQVRGGSKFCESCGSPLGAPSCKHCKQPLNPGARFCGSCGGAQA